MKYRINFTIEDYYNYVGTNPYLPISQKVRQSIPYKFRECGYNLKFKVVKRWPITYRIHISVKMTESEILEVLEEYKDYCHSLENVSYKEIKSSKGCNVH
jgi:hypothetical protein